MKRKTSVRKLHKQFFDHVLRHTLEAQQVSTTPDAPTASEKLVLEAILQTLTQVMYFLDGDEWTDIDYHYSAKYRLHVTLLTAQDEEIESQVIAPRDRDSLSVAFEEHLEDALHEYERDVVDDNREGSPDADGDVMNTEANHTYQFIPYEQWPVESEARIRVAQATFGSHVMQCVRDEVLQYLAGDRGIDAVLIQRVVRDTLCAVLHVVDGGIVVPADARKPQVRYSLETVIYADGDMKRASLTLTTPESSLAAKLDAWWRHHFWNSTDEVQPVSEHGGTAEEVMDWVERNPDFWDGPREAYLKKINKIASLAYKTLRADSRFDGVRLGGHTSKEILLVVGEVYSQEALDSLRAIIEPHLGIMPVEYQVKVF